MNTFGKILILGVFGLVSLFSITPPAKAAENNACEINKRVLSDFNDAVAGKIWGILESKGYKLVSKPEKPYRLKITWGTYYHNGLDKFADAAAKLTTPEGRPYTTYHKTRGFNIFTQHAPSPKGSILAVIRDLPDCSEVVPAAVAHNSQKAVVSEQLGSEPIDQASVHTGSLANAAR